MRMPAKLGLTALAATLLLATAVSAGARNLSVTNQNIRATWSSLEFEGNAVTLRCRVTLEGSLHSRTIAKVARTLIGAITRATVDTANCTNGSVRAERTPWHITYEGFTGTLPIITSVKFLISRFRFNIIVPGLCTGEYGRETDNVTLQAFMSGTALTSITPVITNNHIHLLIGSAFCPFTVALLGSGTITLLGTITNVSVVLI